MLLNNVAEVPRFDITWTMIKPTTSSNKAAVVRTVPSRVVVSPEVPRMVNVVPRLVEHKAAPAEKAWSRLAPESCSNM